MRTDGKVFVVTGAGGGVGRELVRELLSRGSSVAGVDINEDALKETKSVTGNSDRFSIHVADITNYQRIEDLVGQVVAIHGHVDGIINNAGIIQPFITIETLDIKKIDFVMKVNFYGALYMVKAFLPELKKRKEAHILNVSSMGGFLPVPGQVAYGASKAAVMLLSEGMYVELKGSPVNMTVVFPGGINTDIAKNSGAENENMSNKDSKAMKLLLTPEEAARQMLLAMEKNKCRAYIGKDSKLMNFLFKFTPRLALHLIQKALGSNMK